MIKRTSWQPADDRPGWTKRLTWLWDQCDVEWRTDPPEAAWQKCFGEPLPPLRRYDATAQTYHDNTDWIALHDVGDALFLLHVTGRVYVASYPGNCSIGIVKGPGVAL